MINDHELEIATDVLVAGGGPAGAWAAIKAAEAGADVVLVDKGYCGTSGATAAAGTAVWYLPPHAAEREHARYRRDPADRRRLCHDRARPVRGGRRGQS